jgi:hypothetical protein
LKVVPLVAWEEGSSVVVMVSVAAISVVVAWEEENSVVVTAVSVAVTSAAAIEEREPVAVLIVAASEEATTEVLQAIPREEWAVDLEAA